jgi:hypothetical protein
VSVVGWQWGKERRKDFALPESLDVGRVGFAGRRAFFPTDNRQPTLITAGDDCPLFHLPTHPFRSNIQQYG